VRRPTDHALIGRMHQTMTNQALLGQTWPNQDRLWVELDKRRSVLNQYMPVRALHHQSPLETFPVAVFSECPYRPEWEEDLLDLDRVYQYLARGGWFRYNNHGCFRLGTYYLDYHYDKQTMEITFDAIQVAFVCQPVVWLRETIGEVRLFKTQHSQQTGFIRNRFFHQHTLFRCDALYFLPFPNSIGASDIELCVECNARASPLKEKTVSVTIFRHQAVNSQF